MISALIFPDTTVSASDTAKFLLFFEQLAFYLATEPTEAANGPGADAPLAELCKGYAPAPLGDDLSRFARLLSEMERARPDELARLFAAANAPVTGGPAGDRDETSSAGIYGALHRDDGTKAAIQQKERLWQARLVLKLAEMLARREAEVRHGLAQIVSAERNMLAALEEGGGAPAAEPKELPPEPGVELVPLRLKAWAALYLADTSRAAFPVLLAAGRESGVILRDGFENTWKKTAIPLFTLSFPLISPAGTDEVREFLGARNTFRAAAREEMAHLSEILGTVAAGVKVADSTTVAGLAGRAAAWDNMVLEHFRETASGMRQLAFTCFPGVSFTELNQRLFQPEMELAATPRYPNAVLAFPVP